jgi:hypothetical protein
MAVIQHKVFHDLHSVYEPYVVVFEQSAPFGLHAVSSKPLWVHGRGTKGEKRPKKVPDNMPWAQTEMIYVTSINWKQQGQRYHGYLDDVVLMGFGIEDERSGVIDVLAADLLEGLGECDV